MQFGFIKKNSTHIYSINCQLHQMCSDSHFCHFFPRQKARIPPALSHLYFNHNWRWPAAKTPQKCHKSVYIASKRNILSTRTCRHHQSHQPHLTPCSQSTPTRLDSHVNNYGGLGKRGRGQDQDERPNQTTPKKPKEAKRRKKLLRFIF